MTTPISKLARRDHTPLIIEKDELKEIAKRGEPVNPHEMKVFRDRKKRYNFNVSLGVTVSGASLLTATAIGCSLFTAKLERQRHKPNFNVALSADASDEEKARFEHDKAEMKALWAKYKHDQPSK